MTVPEDYGDSNEVITACGRCGTDLTRANSHMTTAVLRCPSCGATNGIGDHNRVVTHAVRKTTERHF